MVYKGETMQTIINQSLSESEDLYKDIENRFLKVGRQYRRHELVNGGL